MPRPRVTSQFVRTPAASPVAVGTRVMAIIGPGSDSFTIQEAVVKGSPGGQDTLAHIAAAIVKVGDYKGTQNYVATIDYLLTDGKIDWSPSGVGAKEPTTGATYYVTYTYEKDEETDYVPYLTDNFDEVATKEGAINVTSGVLDVASYLSEAAQIAFNIGVRQVIICPVVTNDEAGYTAAFTKLENPVNSVNPYYIVPLLGSLAIDEFDAVKALALAHCHKMASEEFGKERMLYTGKKNYGGSGSEIGADDFINEATALLDSREVLCGNYDPIRVISGENVVLDGCFQAVSLAAFRCTQFISDPMMNRPIVGGFIGFNTRWGDIDVDNLVDGGVCVSEELSSIIKVVDDITTNTSDEIEVDINTVEARDILIMTLRNQIEKKFKGARGTNSVSSELKAYTEDYLDQRVGDGTIAGKGSVSANRQSGSLRKWEIAFTYLPVTKVRDINIKFSVDIGLAA